MLMIIQCCHKKETAKMHRRSMQSEKTQFAKLSQIVTSLVKTLISDAGVCNKGSLKGLKRLQEIIKLITADIGTNQISDAIY